MKILSFLLFLFALPVLAVLGHDVYTAYERAEADIYALPGTFQLSDLGWLWVNYAPDSYNSIHESVNPALWDSTILWVLEQTALYVALGPFLVIFAYWFIARLIGLPPYHGKQFSLFGKGEDSYSKELAEKGKAVKYKRR